MPVTVTLTPGKQFGTTEAVDNDKLNQLGQPTFVISGTVSTSDLANAAVTAAKSRADNFFYADGSTTNGASGIGLGIKYTLSWSTNTAPASLVTGLIVAWKANTDCTGRIGVDVGVGGEKELLRNKTEPLGDGDVINGQIVEMRYDGTNWQMTSQVSIPETFRSTTTGASGTYAAIIRPPGGANNITLADLAGRPIILKLHQAAAGGDTLQITVGTASALVAKNLKKSGTTNWAAGDYAANQEVIVIYESTTDAFQTQTTPFSVLSPASIVADGRNIIVKNNATNPTFQVDVSADAVVLQSVSGAGFFLASSVSLTINLDTNGANGLDVGTGAASLQQNWYYFYIISDGTLVRGLASLSSTAPTMPAGYTYRAMIASDYNTTPATNALKTFQCLGREHYLNDETIISGKGSIAFAAIGGGEASAFGAIVPPIAKKFRGIAGAKSAVNVSWQLAADASKMGQVMVNIPVTVTTLDAWDAAGSYEIPIKSGTPQSFFYGIAVSGGATAEIHCSGYTI